jgi:hypothetical protein
MRLADLSWQDLCRLRAAVRRVHMRHYPIDLLTAREADRIIESLLSATAERMLKQLVDGKMADGKLAR